ncbi:MAG: SPOR domain-containing protein, partial [Xanthobacteraceae bacterium]
DGIKTGYTNASGFNLMTSVRRGNRHIVAVVMGGSSASSRDAQMRKLIGDYIRVASTKRTAPLITDATKPVASPSARQAIAAVPIPKPSPIASAVPVLVPEPAPGSDAAVQPIAVRTVAVKPGQQTAAVAGAAQLAQAKAGPELSYAEVTPVPVPRPDLTGVLQVKVASASAQSVPASNSEAAAPPAPHRDGWMIQIGAFEQEYEAKQRLYSALKRAKDLLGGADPFTEAVTKGEKTLYRARFAGLKKEQAEAACKYLKKNEIACMALKD